MKRKHKLNLVYCIGIPLIVGGPLIYLGTNIYANHVFNGLKKSIMHEIMSQAPQFSINHPDINQDGLDDIVIKIRDKTIKYLAEKTPSGIDYKEIK